MLTSLFKQKTTASFSLLLILGFVWGTGYSIARFATTHGVTPLGYSFWQSMGPAVLLSLLYWGTRVMGAPLPLSPRKKHSERGDILYYLIYGLSGIVIPNTNMYYASPHLPASILAMVVNTVPIMAYLMALAAGLEQLNKLRLAGIMCAFLGLAFIVIPHTSLPQSSMIPWVLMALITPLCFAFCSVYITCTRPEHVHPLALSANTLIASSIILAPLVFLSGNFYSFHFPLTLADDVVLLEIILSSIGYILFFQLIKIAGPVYYSMVDTVVVLTGLFWGYVIFDEHLNSWTGLALLCILFGLYLVTKTQRAMEVKKALIL